MVTGLALNVPACGIAETARRVEQFHDVRSPSERSDRRPSADYLSKGRHVRYHTERLLRPARSYAEALHLVEYQHYTQFSRQVAQTLQKLNVPGQIAKAGDDGLHNQAGDLARVLPQNSFTPVQVVVRQDDHLLQNAVRQAGMFCNGSRSRRVQLFQRRPDADRDVFVRAVVSAFELGYFLACP